MAMPVDQRSHLSVEARFATRLDEGKALFVRHEMRMKWKHCRVILLPERARFVKCGAPAGALPRRVPPQ